MIEGIAPGDMCGTRLYALCLSIRGSGGCDNPDDDVWRLACARLGVTRSVGTWRETFDALRRLDPDGRAALAGLMQGEDPYAVEEHAITVRHYWEGELVEFEWYHPFGSYLRARGTSSGTRVFWKERVKVVVGGHHQPPVLHRGLLNTVDDIVDIGGDLISAVAVMWRDNGGGPSLDVLFAGLR